MNNRRIIVKLYNIPCSTEFSFMITTVVDAAEFVMTSIHTHITSVPFMLLLSVIITSLDTRGTLLGRETLEKLKVMESVIMDTSITPA